MTADWRLSAAQRAAAAVRVRLEVQTQHVEQLAALELEATAFDAEYRGRLEAINNRLVEIGPRRSSVTGLSTRFPSEADQSEARSLEAERHRVEQEWKDLREARTRYRSSGLRLDSFCELSPGDVHAVWRMAERVRDGLAAELAELERQLTPGEILQTGAEAPGYAAHREQVERLRQRVAGA